VFQLSNKLSHLYSFRLTNADDQKLVWIMQRFHLDHRSEKSGALRALVEMLYDDFREREIAARLGAQGIQAAPHVVRDPVIPGPALEEDEELSPYVEDPAENPDQDPDYSRLRGEAMEILRMRGEPLFIENIVKEIENQKRKEARIQAPARAESEQLIERFP